MPKEEIKKKPKSIVKSTKEEVLMYTILILGVMSIVSIFAVNIVLIDRMMQSIITENAILKDMQEFQLSDPRVRLEENEVVVTITPEPTNTPVPTETPEVESTATPTTVVLPT